MHVHVHCASSLSSSALQLPAHTRIVIPKPNEEEGLVIGWPTKEADKDELKKYAEGLKEKLSKL